MDDNKIIMLTLTTSEVVVIQASLMCAACEFEDAAEAYETEKEKQDAAELAAKLDMISKKIGDQRREQEEQEG